jgi:site-specific DNA recombinase
MRDDLVKVFCEEYTRHMNELQARHEQSLTSHPSEQAKLLKERTNLVQAIKGGIAPDLIKDDLEAVSKRLKELEEFIK